MAATPPSDSEEKQEEEEGHRFVKINGKFRHREGSPAPAPTGPRAKGKASASPPEAGHVLLLRSTLYQERAHCRSTSLDTAHANRGTCAHTS